MMHNFSLKHNNALFNIIKNNFKCYLNDWSMNYTYSVKVKLDTIIEVTREYLKFWGFELVEEKECI